jgi:hypothetical protein
VRVEHDLLSIVAEFQATVGDPTSPARGRGGREFAGPHGEEKATDHKIGDLGVDRVARIGHAVGEMAEGPEKLGRQGALALGGGVEVVESLEEGLDAGQQLGAAFDVKGAALETVPERRSQVACGTAHS